MLEARNVGPVLAEPLLSQLSEFIAARTGLHFPKERWRDLDRALGPAARELGFAEAASCSRWLLSSDPTRGQIEILASHLTVGETFFFRDRGSFGALEERVLPELLRLHGGERRLRKAAEGMYGEWSFRDAPAWIRRHSERRKDRRFELEPRIRARVTFSCLNLADDAYRSLATNATNAMGVILCRNVPMRAAA